MLLFVMGLLSGALASDTVPSNARALAQREIRTVTVEGELARCPCQKSCGCETDGFVILDPPPKGRKSFGVTFLTLPSTPDPLVIGGRYEADVSPAGVLDVRWQSPSPLATWIQANGGILVLPPFAWLLLAGVVAFARILASWVFRRSVPAVSDAEPGAELTFAPWPWTEAVLSLVSAASWLALFLLGCLGAWFHSALYLCGALLAFEVVASGARWRHRTGRQFLLAAAIAFVPTVLFAAFIIHFGIVLADDTSLVLFGNLLLAPFVPWFVARRIGRALTVLTSRFELQLRDRHLQWRLRVGPRVGDWIRIPYDGLRPEIRGTRRGVFLDLGGGQSLQASGTSLRRMARIRNALAERAVHDGLDAEAFDAVWALTRGSRSSVSQPNVRLLPMVASIVGAFPTAGMLVFVGWGAFQGSDFALGFSLVGSAVAFGVVVWATGSLLADPRPYRDVAQWFDREAERS